MLRISGFVLCLLSSEWYEALRFKTSEGGDDIRKLRLKDGNPKQFDSLIRLGCGLSTAIPSDLAGLLRLATLAHDYRLEDVSAVLEKEIVRRFLNIETCCDLLEQAQQCGLTEVVASARRFALDSFDEVAATDSFLRLAEDTVSDLIDDDSLQVGEALVFRAAARWMRGQYDGANGEESGELRGKGILGKVRFCLMPPEFLAGEARGVLPELEGMEDLLQEAHSVALNPFQASYCAAIQARSIEGCSVRMTGMRPWGRVCERSVVRPLAGKSPHERAAADRARAVPRTRRMRHVADRARAPRG